MKYLKKFETEAEKTAWLGGSEFVTPNVVLTGDVVGYNLIDPASIPLHIEAIEDLTISFGNTYEYSKDNATWSSGTSSTVISASAGEKVYFRARPASQEYGIGTFTISNGTCNVAGNIMSMVHGSNFKGKISISTSRQFYQLFYSNPNIIDASNLILPATALSEGCYYNMFSNCSGLVAAPALPATQLQKLCYRSMFSDCSSLIAAPELPATQLLAQSYYSMFNRCSRLKYIKMLATDISAYECLFYWVNGVASGGTFVKNSAATWTTTGANGVPSGWTVETADA